ncbi:MAG TPA: winged helix DNA-binding domain-containing protein [Bacteroidia bacterium]|nr:winged helix DNA-binding domain-containing protein [Bacteroidia bacterium]
MLAKELLALRLHASHISGTRHQSPGALVAWLGAVQSQEFNHAKWALGVRLPGMTEADIDLAIANREIVRAWMLRGTLHLMAAEDYRWMITLVGPGCRARTQSMNKKLGLDETTLAKAVAITCETLQGGKALERTEIFRAIEAQGIGLAGLRGTFVLYEAAHGGKICLGPMKDKQDTYVLVEEWLPPTGTLSREEAVTELARRYFQSHGPATLQDFVAWSGLGVREARQGLLENQAGLDKVAFEGNDYWMGMQDVGANLPDLLLLPGFDEYLIAYKDRSIILETAHHSKVITSNGIFRPIIVVGGKVVGTWQKAAKRDRLELLAQYFDAPAPQLSQDAQLTALRHFHGLG